VGCWGAVNLLNTSYSQTCGRTHFSELSSRSKTEMHQNLPSVSWWMRQTCCAGGSNEVSGCRRCTERQSGECVTPASDLPSVWSVKVAVPIESGGSRDEARTAVDQRGNACWLYRRIFGRRLGARPPSLQFFFVNLPPSPNPLSRNSTAL